MSIAAAVLVGVAAGCTVTGAAFAAGYVLGTRDQHSADTDQLHAARQAAEVEASKRQHPSWPGGPDAQVIPFPTGPRPVA